MINERFNPDGLVLSKSYADTMNEVVLPRLAQQRQDIVLENGPKLFCRCYEAEAPVGTVLIVHGFTENADKFAELIYSLLENRYSVLAYDQRGHGHSWRDPEIADISLTHVDRFDDYVEDLARVADGPLAAMPRPWLLFAHSMGGAVSMLYMERHPGVFAGAALCAPMIAPNLGGLPPAVARRLCGVETALGRDKKRIFASKPYTKAEDFATSCAAGRERFDWYEALRVKTPEFQNNGPTYGWTREAIRSSRMILAPGAVEGIDAPVRLYAAEDDSSVMPDAQKAFAARLRDGSRTLVKGSKHEIYRSADAVLFPWWRDVLEFYASRTRGETSEQ